MENAHTVSLRHILLVLALLAVLALQCVTSLITESTTVDEPNFIGGGITFLTFGAEAHRAFFMGENHPPLGYLCNALPVLFMKGLAYPASDGEWLGTGLWRFGMHFLFDLNMRRSEEIVRRCRIVTVVFSMMLGLLVFQLARRFYGTGAGLFSLLLYCFSPTVIGLSRYAVIDVCGTFFMVLSICAFYEFLVEMSARNVVFAGIAFGLAQLGKYAALLLIPCYAILLTIRLLTRGAGEDRYAPVLRLCAIFAIGYAVVWAGYGFDMGSLRDIRKIEPFIRECGGVWYFPDAARRSMGTFHRGNVPLTAYVRGLYNLYRHARLGHPAFLMGRVSTGGWWYYYIAAFLLKTPLPVLMLLTARLCLRKRLSGEGGFEGAMLLVPVGIVFLLSLRSGQNVGVRHILLVYPLLYVFIGGLAAIPFHRTAAGVLFRCMLAFAAAWHVHGTLSVRPHYLAYFNELAGGPSNGYRCLVDSNLDWGQDVKGLKEYMQKNRIEKVTLSAICLRGCLDYYAINYEPLRNYLKGGAEGSEPSVRGVVAVSATALADMWDPQRRTHRWLSRHRPVDNVGYSILIYRFD